MPVQRTPGGVLLSIFVVACGDDGGSSTSAGGDPAGSSSAQTSAASGTTSASTGPGASSSSGSAGGEGPSSSSSSGGQGGSGAGSTGGAGGQGGAASQGGGGGGEQGGAGQGGEPATIGSGGSAGTGGTGTGGSGTGGGVPPDGTRVRIVAANLTSGNGQDYDPGHGIRILQGIDGDIILVQEMTYGADNAAAMRNFANQICGIDCDVVRETSLNNGYLPNGVVSRYPIINFGVWDDPNLSNREFFWARIDLPGPGDLLAVSVHLHTNVSSHQSEGETLVARINEERGPDDVVVLGGDFNTDDTTDVLFGELDDIFRVTEPYPVDQNDNPHTNENRTKRYDWVLADPGLDALEIPVVIGSLVFDTGLVVDTRVHTPLRDISPAQFNDSDQSVVMQHMAVVRDFAFAAVQ